MTGAQTSSIHRRGSPRILCDGNCWNADMLGCTLHGGWTNMLDVFAIFKSEVEVNGWLVMQRCINRQLETMQQCLS